jgi:hypothetical protein
VARAKGRATPSGAKAVMMMKYKDNAWISCGMEVYSSVPTGIVNSPNVISFLRRLLPGTKKLEEQSLSRLLGLNVLSNISCKRASSRVGCFSRIEENKGLKEEVVPAFGAGAGAAAGALSSCV